MKLRFFILFISVIFCTHIAYSATIDEGKNLYLEGKFENALPILMENYEKNSTNKLNPSLNQWIGVCLYNLGKYDESTKYINFAASKGVTESFKYLADLKLKSYSFTEADNYIRKYDQALKKLKKPIPDDAQILQNQITQAKIMLDHVESITIIDSIIVNKASFFKYYKIAPEAGSLNTPSSVLSSNSKTDGVVFMPESKEKMLWAAIDTSGVETLMESNKLIDGTWDKPHKIGKNFSNGGDAIYPYLMPDGATLYFASNGKNSIGGYDIFIARKSAETGEYLQPQNVGMPYNSPYDDYLLVIDEFTGAGWWATDRNQIPGKLTIYVYIPNEVRKNYSTDKPNLISLAKISSIKETQDSAANYSVLLEDIKNINPNKVIKKKEFVFPISKDKIYYSMSDFKSAEARSIMHKWISANDALNNNLNKLKEFRTKYQNSPSDSALKSKILQIEQTILNQYNDLNTLSNSIIRAEK